MKRLKGPELKMPDLKAPAFLADVYWDLRDRRLLPLIALVVVAIAAVPFLLGDDEEAIVPPLTAGSGIGSEAASASKLTVVEAQPGLRDYRKRLRGRSPSDPFAPRLTAPQLDGAKLNDPKPGESASGAGSASSSGGEGPGDKRGGGAANTPGSGSGEGSPPAKTENDEGSAAQPPSQAYGATIDVRIVREGGTTAEAEAKSESAKPIVRHNVQPQSPLPGPNLPVFRYMGPSREAEGHRPLLLISSDVRSVFGDSRCVAGDEACQLLEVEPGLPVTFVYGSAEVHYTVTVLGIAGQAVPGGQG